MSTEKTEQTVTRHFGIAKYCIKNNLPFKADFMLPSGRTFISEFLFNYKWKLFGKDRYSSQENEIFKGLLLNGSTITNDMYAIYILYTDDNYDNDIKRFMKEWHIYMLMYCLIKKNYDLIL
jgi:hypothetical protein